MKMYVSTYISIVLNPLFSLKLPNVRRNLNTSLAIGQYLTIIQLPLSHKYPCQQVCTCWWLYHFSHNLFIFSLHIIFLYIHRYLNTKVLHSSCHMNFILPITCPLYQQNTFKFFCNLHTKIIIYFRLEKQKNEDDVTISEKKTQAEEMRQKYAALQKQCETLRDEVNDEIEHLKKNKESLEVHIIKCILYP